MKTVPRPIIWLDYKTVKIINNRVNVRLDKERLLMINPITELEQSNIKLKQIKALNIPLPWLGQRTARCMQVIFDKDRFFEDIEFTNSDFPRENVWDTICFQTEEQRTNWQEKIKEFLHC